ncbi:MAG: CPBP family glutamic-type intramembrane protease, partial [Ilumatobacteraceae bacterium]
MSELPPPTTAPAGWYPDPEGRPGPRYFDGHRWHDPVSAGRLEPARPPHATLPISAAVGALVILTTSLIGGRILIDQLVPLGWPVLVYVVVLTVIGYGPSVAWCVHVSRRHGRGRLADDIGLRFRWSDLGWGPLIWLCAVVCQVVVAAVVLTAGVPTSSNTEGIAELDADRAYVVALLLTAVVAAPVVEEMVFRGVVMRGLLSRFGVVVTVGVQAVLFGLAHVDPVRGAGNVGLVAILSGVGVALGAAAFLLRRIGPVMIAHAILNGVVLAIVLTGVADRLQDDLESRGREAGAVVEQPHVVDEAHTTHPGGEHQQRVAVDLVERDERVPVHDRG